MATIKLKRGAGVPSSLAAGEPAMDTATGRVYISKDGSNIIEVGSGAASSNITGNLTVGGTAAITGTLTSGSATVASLTSSGAVSGTNATFSGTINGVDPATWTAGYNDKINSAGFNTSTGVLTLTQQDSGTVTTDLDGRFPVYKSGTFTPQFTDGSSAGSPAKAEGSYVALQIGGVTVVSFVTINLIDVNTSGLTSGNNVIISSIPSDARVTLSPSLGNYDNVVSIFRGINLVSVGAQVVATYGGSAGTLLLLEQDETGNTPLTVGDFTSGSNGLALKLQIQ